MQVAHVLTQRLKEFHSNQAGNMTFVNVTTALWLVLMFSFVFNTGRVNHSRVKTQTAADLAAASAMDRTADNMKDIVLIQHSIGEYTSFIILHEAWGGVGLDKNESADTSEFDNDLKSAWEAYKAASSAAGKNESDPAYDTVKEEVVASEESTEFDSKTRLKKLLTWVYRVKTMARVLELIPYTKALGEAIHAFADLVELKIWQEYQTANAIHEAAVKLVTLKKNIRDRVLPAMKKALVEIVKQHPERVQDIAKTVVKVTDQDMKVMVVGANGRPELPVEIDPFAKMESYTKVEHLPIEQTAEAQSMLAIAERVRSETETVAADRRQIVKVTQLARATFPWVVYHRETLLQGMKSFMTLAQTEKHYKHYTEAYSLYVLNYLQLEEDMGLYVIKDSGINKGFELWTEDPDKADELFSYLVLTHVKEPPVLGVPVVYSRNNKQGIHAIAQATLYNGNSQKRNPIHIDLTIKRITPNLQPVVGYNTLGWVEPQNELIAKTDEGGAPSPRQPRYELNWQSKLEPVSNVMLEAARRNRSILPSELQPIAEQFFLSRPEELLVN